MCKKLLDLYLAHGKHSIIVRSNIKWSSKHWLGKSKDVHILNINVLSQIIFPKGFNSSCLQYIRNAYFFFIFARNGCC